EGRPTAHGKAMAAAPLHPRLAHMVLTAADTARAADLAALLEERDLLGPGAPAELSLRLAALRRPGAAREADPAIRARVRENAARIRKGLKGRGGRKESLGALLARAYPGRVAIRRPGAA